MMLLNNNYNVGGMTWVVLMIIMVGWWFLREFLFRIFFYYVK
jgi:hypothetical protein